jgi:hypothetical protein
MLTTTHTIKRIAMLLALAGSAAALAAPGAIAGSNSRYGPPDGWYSHIVSLTKASVAARYGPPDGWYTYIASLTKARAAAHEHSTLIDGRSPDTKDAAQAAHASSVTPSGNGGRILDGRSRDTRDAAQAAQASLLAPVDGRSPDTSDAAQAAQANLLTPMDGRSPDTRDAAFLAHAPVVTVVESAGFQWGDFGIGIAAAVGLMLVLFVSIRLLTGRHGRKQPGPVATA